MVMVMILRSTSTCFQQGLKPQGESKQMREIAEIL
jgi:hypothetical protein